MGYLNVRLLRQEIAKKTAQHIVSDNRINNAIEKKFDVKKDKFLEEFIKHPVTQELIIRPKDSQFFTTNNGGNLYGLLGFEDGEKPAEELYDYLDKSITIDTNSKRVRVKDDKILIETPISLPTLDDVDQAMSQEAPLPWTTQSFTSLIQNGITGFGQFVAGMFKKVPQSFSKEGLETHGKQLREQTLKPIKYVNDLLAKFKNNITHGR